MELIYSQTRRKILKGQSFRNPRFFTGAEEGVSKVWIDGDWPKIEAAYADAGVRTLRLDNVPAAVSFVLPEPEREEIEIPADWRDLPWTQPDERGLSLRRLAASVSDVPVINKAQAVEAIEAHLGGGQEASE